jgi:hypothetical protein
LVVLGAYLDTQSHVAEDIVFENCRLWCDWGASFKLWSQPYTNTFRNIEMRDCRLLRVMDRPLHVKDTCGSADTRIENVRFENIEIDMVGLPLRHVLQKSDDMGYPGDSFAKALTLAYVACLHPKTDHGNQKFVNVADPTGYRSCIRNLVFDNFSFPGFRPPLVSELVTVVPGQEIRDIEFKNVPPLEIRSRGNVGSVNVDASKLTH